MPQLTWSDSYSVGVEELDKQHQGIINIINELYQLYSEDNLQKSQLEEIFTKLIDYAEKHFKSEERYFELYAYPERDNHVKMHDSYNDKVNSLKEDYLKTNNKETLFAINNFLNEWWTWHINNADKQYAKYFDESGLK